jgi:23S rRNA (uracil1939-C5)-methyltransferase
LHFVREDGRLRLGYKRRRTNDAFALMECPIATPNLIRAAAAVAECVEPTPWADAADEAELFTNERGVLMLSVQLRPGVDEDQSSFTACMERLRERLPELVGAGLYRQAKRAGELPTVIAAWGAAELESSVDGRSYRVSRGAFFQVNTRGTEKLVKLVCGDRRGALVWDLYAGVGLFSVALAERFERVVAVESAPYAIPSLQANLRAAGEQHRAIENTTVEFLRRTAMPSSRKPPQLVVADPPRAGLGAEVCRLLAQVGAAEMVYVSCDPVTLGRDLATLIESGYRLRALHLVDLFAQTFHIETVAVLARG